jgi:hypothetical protein
MGRLRYTKRDFVFAAQVVRRALDALEAVAVNSRQKRTVRRAVATVAAAFCDAFKEANPLFREGDFLQACGLRWPDEYDRSALRYAELPDEFWRSFWRWLEEEDEE